MLRREKQNDESQLRFFEKHRLNDESQPHPHKDDDKIGWFLIKRFHRKLKTDELKRL